MYSLTELTAKIEQAIETMGEASHLHPDWITHVVMSQYTDIQGKDSDFYTIMARTYIRDQVRKRLNGYQADDPQVIEYFNRLQERYLLDDDGEQVAIRVQDMTRAQRLQKAAELRTMGAGCYQHADELERYDAMIAA